MTHELTHCILEHPPSAVVSAAGMRHFNAELEDEADWAGGALLVPRAGALALLSQGMDVSDVAAHFGVSHQLAGWRVNGTGAAAQIRRRGRWQRPPEPTARPIVTPPRSPSRSS